MIADEIVNDVVGEMRMYSLSNQALHFATFSDRAPAIFDVIPKSGATKRRFALES